MYFSKLPINTFKETPANADVVSHQLMLRAGLIRRLGAGLYSWLPLGVRVLNKVQNIIREEMNNSGALEVLMPTVQPAELWQESKRWDVFGPELLRFTDRHNRDYCLGPTHEEVITDIARSELKSYRQLPVNYYQIQTKFRDEVRPRFGVMRAREFTMKDAYSFHLDEASLAQGYQLMRKTYQRIFDRMQLEYRIVEADTGAIGGNQSEEFQVLAASGEDAIAYSDDDNYAANVEVVELKPSTLEAPPPRAQLERVATPGIGSIAELAEHLAINGNQCLKTLLVAGTESAAVALVLRGDHALNAIKAAKLPEVASPLTMLQPADVRSATGSIPGSVGPIGLEIPLFIDHSAALVADFVCGANVEGYHYTGANWGRDLPRPATVDLRNAVAGDPCPTGSGQLKIARGIEVGQIFALGTKYSLALDASVLDPDGQPRHMPMGCYGIGVTRVVAAAIEQNHDVNGIIWPQAISPFDVIVIPINMEKSERVRVATEALYAKLRGNGFDVLLDDRALRPGVKFADADLIGFPHRIVVGERGLEQGTLEYKSRRAAEPESIGADSVIDDLRARMTHAQQAP
jgi:prolyl-tRNA synthetase